LTSPSSLDGSPDSPLQIAAANVSPWFVPSISALTRLTSSASSSAAWWARSSSRSAASGSVGSLSAPGPVLLVRRVVYPAGYGAGLPGGPLGAASRRLLLLLPRGRSALFDVIAVPMCSSL
jgi:hypothetical protein